MAQHAKFSPVTDADIDDLADRLSAAVVAAGPMVVAFSGGVDSSLLAVAARKALGKEGVVAVTANSESLADGELERCEQITTAWDIPWQTVTTDELSDDRYVVNNKDRCYWCKSALMDQLEPLAKQQNAVVTLGVNLDDLGDHRPGQLAAKERGAVFPMVDAELRKPNVRALAKHWGVSTWDRPAMPCLSSRVPYGTHVTVSLLSKVDRAETALRNLGFEDVRVRHYGDTARIELPSDLLVKAAEHNSAIVNAVEAVGYQYVTLDLAGLRSGNLNNSAAPTPEALPNRG